MRDTACEVFQQPLSTTKREANYKIREVRDLRRVASSQCLCGSVLQPIAPFDGYVMAARQLRLLC